MRLIIRHTLFKPLKMTVASSKMSDFENSKSKTDSHSWKNSTRHLPTSLLNCGDDNYKRKDGLAKGNSVDNSTISLHIAASENSTENSNEKKKEVEVMQFKASQVLLDLNQKNVRKSKKTKAKEVMLKNRVSYDPNKAHKSEVPVATGIVSTAPITTRQRRALPSLESGDPCEIPIKKRITETHLKSMQDGIKSKRTLDKEIKKGLSEKMKNLRNQRTTKSLVQKIASLTAKTDQPVSKATESNFDPFDPTDDFLECVVASDVEPEVEHKNILPSPSCPPSQSTPKTLKNPEDLSKAGYFKRKKEVEKIAEKLLGPGHKIVTNTPQKVTVEEAAEYFVLHGCKDIQYSGLDRRFYPSLSTVKRYIKKLKDDLKNMAKDGLASAILNDLNSMEEFPFDKARVNVGVDKELRTIEKLVESGEKIAAAEADGTKTPAQIAQLKKNLNSVKATPMMRNILLKRFVPPVVHIGITAVSSAVKYCRKNGKGPELLAAIESMGVKTHQGTSDFTGPNCRKILKFFSEHPEIDGFAIDLLRAYAKIEKFAVARDLTEEEINSMDLAIKEYFDIMDSRYPDFAGAKVKLHILRFHVMPFVREFKSWGKFSEQGKLTQANSLTNNTVTALEGIHKVKNQTDLRIKCGDDNQKLNILWRCSS
uniref:Uncharacterized protein n=1 Tax=Panagrolaimus davidi TaxID=227884 RepID=A0A914PH36_9BILA